MLFVVFLVYLIGAGWWVLKEGSRKEDGYCTSLFSDFHALTRCVFFMSRAATQLSKNAFISVGLFLGRSIIWSSYIGVPFLPHRGHFFALKFI